MAEGSALIGLGCSVAARPTSSVPAKEKAAVTKTEHTPGKPFARAPGSCHSLAPQYEPYSPELGPPPRMKTKLAMRKIAIVSSLRHDDQNSSSAKPQVPKLRVTDGQNSYKGNIAWNSHVESKDNHREDGNPYSYIDCLIRIPELDGEGSGCKLQR